MTDTDLDARRLELLRRRLAGSGLREQDPAESVAVAADPGRGERTDGQKRMWFVHSVDPSGVLLNVCLSYRISGEVDLARLHEIGRA